MKVAVLGGGIAGLTAAYQLNNAGKDVVVFEKEKDVGGLSRTINVKGNRFDFGGHRFWTKKDDINKFLKDLLKDELIKVPRSSKIYFNKKFFDYPLKFNAISSLGFIKTMITGIDFAYGRMIYHFKKDLPNRSFEDQIIRMFGFQLYKYFFKDYTEKIWGIPCTRLSNEWAVQRIKGLTVRSVIKNMLWKGKDVATLIDEFYYPKLGIVRISEKMAESLNVKNEPVTRIEHDDRRILSVNGENADVFVSTIPVTELAMMLDPPEDVRKSINLLKYRDITFLFLAFRGKTLTPESWIYFPDPNIPFGRIHEPKNWSRHMCKEGHSSVVVEFFCNKGDSTWVAKDKDIIKQGLECLKRVGLWKNQKIEDACVVRIEKCYPMYEIGYDEHVKKVKKFISKFDNLRIIGRNGTFKYLNIDHVIEMGIKCADNIIKNKRESLDYIGSEKEYQEEKSSKNKNKGKRQS